MTESSRQDPPRLEQWSAASFGERLLAPDSAGQVFVLEGLSPSNLHREAVELRRVLRQNNLPLFILDPTGRVGGHKTFFDVLVAYGKLAREHGLLSEKAAQLFEFVSTDREARGALSFKSYGRLHVGSLCRVWTSLSQDLPAALVVVNAHRCRPSELETLEHLTNFFFADPLEQLSPEVEAIEQGQGRLAYVVPGDEFPFDLAQIPTVDIDCTAAAEETVRRFLSDPEVVRRFVDSTGGDPQRLDDLVETLPENIEHFWLHRYHQLEPREQSLVDVLAAAEQPISLEVLHEALSKLGDADYLARSLRHLVDIGIVERQVTAGAVEVQIESARLAAAVQETFAAPRAAEVHGALAHAALSVEGEEVSSIFTARHLMAAGELKQGFSYGRDAVRRLMNQRDYDRATDVLATLLEHAEETDDLVAIHRQLISAHRALGQYRKALTHCAELESLLETESERAQLRYDRGYLLLKLGEYDDALELFERSAAIDAGDKEERLVIWLKAKLGEGEAHYARGSHEQTRQRVAAIVERIAEVREEAKGMQRILDQTLVRARNLKIKVLLISRSCEEARELLDSNYELAKEWGWVDEMARAEANKGLVALEEKDFEDAERRIRRSLEMSQSPEVVPRSHNFLNLSIILQNKYVFDDALGYCLEGMRAARQASDETVYSIAAHNLVTLYLTLGAYDRARSIIEHVRQDRLTHVQRRFVGKYAFEILQANLFVYRERYEEALQTLRSIEPSKCHNETQKLALQEARLRSIEAHVALGQLEAAREVLESIECPDREETQPQLVALHELGRARIALAQDDPCVAIEANDRAAELARDAGYLWDETSARLLQARALNRLERGGEAKLLVEQTLEKLSILAESVPEAQRDHFYAIPVHRKLVELGAELDANVPAAFASRREEPGVEELNSSSTPTDDPAFKRWRGRYSEIVGEDPKLHQLFRVVDRVAGSDSPVLIQGESGTGKELMAEAVHAQSTYADGPFVKVNCAAFVEDLLLSELFGHVKGAFTGAVSEKVGRFELADKGTIFLDEIGDVSPKTQVALLRVLQEGTFEKVGSTETQQVDVRVVCATNRDLEQMVEDGDFRLDLYYRLKGVILEVPPLRERRQDIPRLVEHFSRRFAGEGEPKRVSREALEFLSSYSWPGNVRELQHFIKNILLFVEGDTVEMGHLRELGEFFSDGELVDELPDIDFDVPLADYEQVGETFEDPEGALVDQIVGEGLSLSGIKKRLELESIRLALTETGGNITQAAKILQMKRPRLSQIVNSTEELLALKNELVG